MFRIFKQHKAEMLHITKAERIMMEVAIRKADAEAMVKRIAELRDTGITWLRQG